MTETLSSPGGTQRPLGTPQTPMARTPRGTRAAAPEAPEGFVNSWLQGPFAPVDEEVTAYDLKVTGTIPKELEDGRLLRVGPNPVDPQDPVTYNWFTGNGMVHGVRIRDGKA